MGDNNRFQSHKDELLNWVHQIQDSMEAVAKRRSMKLLIAPSFISSSGALMFVVDSSLLHASALSFLFKLLPHPVDYLIFKCMLLQQMSL